MVIQLGLEPPTKWINQIFILLMKVELFLTLNPIFGTSLLLIAKKQNEPFPH
jgi:hypothetical protein